MRPNKLFSIKKYCTFFPSADSEVEWKLYLGIVIFLLTRDIPGQGLLSQIIRRNKKSSKTKEYQTNSELDYSLLRGSDSKLFEMKDAFLSLNIKASKLWRIGVPTWGSSSSWLLKLWYRSRVDAPYWKPIIVHTRFPILSPTLVCPKL